MDGIERIVMEPDCSHVAPSDSRFKARMRFHQSWYRRHVLHLTPGVNPSAIYKRYGNMLTLEDASAGYNFLTPDITAYVDRRIKTDSSSINSSRLLGNLLSSQPMCFNLFAPLAMDMQLASRLVRVLAGVSDDVTVTDVVIEYAPEPEHHLQDRSAFDAWIGYVRPGGIRGFIGIETKLTEPFSTERYAFDERYARWCKKSDWWWRPGAEERFSSNQVNQLWRNHLLAFAMLHQQDSPFNEAFSTVLYHDADTSCTRSLAAYRPLLTDEANHTLLEWPLSQVMSQWQSAISSGPEEEWLSSFKQRYYDMRASEPAWEVYRAAEA